MKRAIGRNGFKKIYSYTWENQGNDKKVFRAKIKGLTVKVSLKSFLSLMLPLTYGKVNSRTGKKLRNQTLIISSKSIITGIFFFIIYTGYFTLSE